MRSEITVVKSRSYASRVTKLRFEGHKVPPSRPQSYVFTTSKLCFRGVKIMVFWGFSAIFMDKTNNIRGCQKGLKSVKNYMSTSCA